MLYEKSSKLNLCLQQLKDLNLNFVRQLLKERKDDFIDLKPTLWAIMFIKVETKDALLQAINEEYVEAVEVLLNHAEGEPWVKQLHLSLT